MLARSAREVRAKAYPVRQLYPTISARHRLVVLRAAGA